MRPTVTLANAFILASLLSTSAARADGDCPPGSVYKTQDSFSWCEPTVCANDSQCSTSEVCRPIGLCLEIGTLADAATGDGPKRLVVTQRCAPDKTCPQKQTCSDVNRCVSKVVADKMGLLSLPAPSASPEWQAGAKKACGCDVVGARTASSGAAVFALAISLLALRRKRA